MSKLIFAVRASSGRRVREKDLLSQARRDSGEPARLLILLSTTMDATDAIARDDWHALLETHPIFRLPEPQPGPGRSLTAQSLELSTATLHTDSDSDYDYILSGRRQLMALRDADLIVAAGAELRITSLWDTKLGRGIGKSYKVRRYMHNVGTD